VTRSTRSAVVAAVLSVGLLSGCSAGQIAQTAQVQPGVPGLNTQAPDRKVYLRNVTVDYPGPKGYAPGANAPLTLWIFNNTTDPVTLTGVEGPGQVVVSAGDNKAAPCVVPRSATPVPPTSAPPSASGSASASGKPSVKPSVVASPSPSASPSATPAGSATIKLTIPALSCLELSHRAALYLQVAGLPGKLDSSGTLKGVVFHLTDSAGQSFTIGTEANPLNIPVSVPESPLPRS